MSLLSANVSTTQSPDVIESPFTAIGSSRLTTRERMLCEKVRADLRALGARNEKIVTGIRFSQLSGSDELLPVGYELTLRKGGSSVTAYLNVELEYRDGFDNDWAARVFLYPLAAVHNGLAIELSQTMTTLGYQILVARRGALGESEQLIRMDSICTSSFYDQGHSASAGMIEFGCDCYMQRHLAKMQILETGGLSILSPHSGRGNGPKVLSSEIQIRNFAIRHNASQIPDTYQAHAMQGHASDSRKHFYWIDALILAKLFGIERCTLLTNNPEKIAAVSEAGMVANVRQHKDESNESYYRGIDGMAKREAAGHLTLCRGRRSHPESSPSCSRRPQTSKS